MFGESYAASATQTTGGFLVLLSHTVKDRIDLLTVQNIEFKGKAQTYLRRQLESAKDLHPLDGVSIRQNLSSEWGSLLTQHLMRVHHHLDRDDSDIVAYTAWRYATLTAWGEASAAREIALDLKTSIHTIHYRLKLARDKGILTSPGAGARLGR